jgi:D-amino peptidase
MTRLLIIADMEGITGLSHYEQCIRGHESYPEGVELLCTEINVIARASRSSGAQSVSVIDWHGGGGNVDPELLDDGVEVVPEDLSAGFDLAMLIGFHPMAGDAQGFISHTMRQGLAVEVGGQQVGELSLLAWWLGEHGIPVGLISGDRAATAEADRFFPETPCHTVKRAISWHEAECVPTRQSHEALSARVTRVLEQRGRWQTYRPALPIPFRMKLRDPNPMPGLIPWLTEQEDGWLAGSVDHARDLIDLIDVISALINLQHRNNFIAAIEDEPETASALQRMRSHQIEQGKTSGHWTP